MMKKGYMRDWSFITLPPDDAIACGKGGVSVRGRDYINSLFDRIIELEEKLKEARKWLDMGSPAEAKQIINEALKPYEYSGEKK